MCREGQLVAQILIKTIIITLFFPLKGLSFLNSYKHQALTQAVREKIFTLK